MNLVQLPGQTAFYKGKVRDVYTIRDQWLLMVASNRISAFDVILPREIPFKGQVLNQIAAYMLEATRDICPNWLLSVPTASSSLGKKCDPFKIEMVIRGNLTGHAWRTYQSGKNELCGAPLPAGMKENDFFPEPIITPSTKAEIGHDEDISPLQIVERGLATKNEWEQISAYTQALFERGKEIAGTRGLILADTKYEFGKYRGEIMLMDEIHTPDSSRYFYAKGFEERQQNEVRQKQLSKEFVREWLIENNFMGKEGQVVPLMTDKWVETISLRYIELYETLTGKNFSGEELEENEIRNRIIRSLNTI